MALRITVNGEAREVADGLSVAGLLAELGVRPELAAVERNGAVVPRREHAQTPLQEGDQIEVVTFVGGG